MWDHFIISEQELKKMSYDMSFIPPLDRPMPQREGKTEEDILLDKEQLIAELNSNTQ